MPIRRRFFTLLISTSLLALAANATEPAATADAQIADAQISEARTAVNALQAELQTALQTALRDGGPIAAIEVCQLQALPITASIGEEQKLHIRRTALKLRNPANAPDEWEAQQLADFAARAERGESLAAMETVSRESGEFRYMKAIPTGAACTACHGTQIAEPLETALNERYPDDQATGFEAGDLRGAFSVRIAADDSALRPQID
jgi:hypothetical protein